MTTLLSRLWTRRWLRILAWTALTVVTVLALTWEWTSWMGACRLQTAVKRLEQEGETLDFRSNTPASVPDATNFCAIPLLHNLAGVQEQPGDRSEAGQRLVRLKSAALPNSGPGVRPKIATGVTLGQPLDCQAWAQWLGAPEDPAGAPQAVVTFLARHDELIAEFRSGLQREEAQWTPSWRDRPLPDNLFAVALPVYSWVRGLEQMLGLRAAAAAQAGHPEMAQEAALLTTRFTQADLQDPFIIGLLVGCSDAVWATGSVWELCKAHAGTAEDFRRLEIALRRLDFQRASLIAWRGERAALVTVSEYMKRTRDPVYFAGINEQQFPPGWLARFFPPGWFDANAAVVIDLEDQYVIHPLRAGGLLAVEHSGLDAEIIRRKNTWRWDSFVAALTLPAISSVSPRAVYAQCVTSQAVAACALERYRCANGEYPETLAAAEIKDEPPLPLDIFSGRSFGYRRTADGYYALWSVGPDREDGGGVRVLDPHNPGSTKFSDPAYHGDWVWDFVPASALRSPGKTGS